MSTWVLRCSFSKSAFVCGAQILRVLTYLVNQPLFSWITDSRWNLFCYHLCHNIIAIIVNFFILIIIMMILCFSGVTIYCFFPNNLTKFLFFLSFAVTLSVLRDQTLRIREISWLSGSILTKTNSKLLKTGSLNCCLLQRGIYLMMKCLSILWMSQRYHWNLV